MKIVNFLKIIKFSELEAEKHPRKDSKEAKKQTAPPQESAPKAKGK